MRRIPLIVALLTTVLALSTAGAAHAADTTIPFSGLADGTAIEDQYAPQGVVFGTATAFGFGDVSPGCRPGTTTARNGRAALGGCGGSSEFPRFASLGAFSSFRSRISMRVFTGGSADESLSTASVVLRVYDVHRALIATSDEVPLTVVGQTLSIDVTTPQIAFFSIEKRGTMPNAPQIDDFTYDNPPVPPNPQIAVGVQGDGARLRQGGATDVTVRILRFNGSNGNVALSAGDLPGGVSSATFTPNPAGGSAFLTTAVLHLTAPAYATAGHFRPTITANPSGSAGSAPDSAAFDLDVVPPFRFSVAPTARVAPCTPTSIPMALDVEPGYTDPITFTVNHTNNTIDTNLPASYTPGFSAPLTALGLSAAPGANKAGDDTLTVTAASGPFSVTQTVAVDRYPGSLDGIKVAVNADVNAATVVAPRLGSPGTTLRVLGTGLCADSRVYFGPGDSQGAPLESRDPGGRVALVHVPFTAVSGVPTLSGPDATGHAANAPAFSRALTVQTYRDTFGFSFANFTSDGPSWGDIVDLFGKDKTQLKIDPCDAVTFGLVDCGVKTGIPKPEVFIYWRTISGYGETGNCFGVDLASYRLWSRRKAMSDFGPPGATWPFDLDGTAGPAPALRFYARQMMWAQSASETMKIRAGAVGRQNPASMRQAIQAALDQGHPAMMSIRSGDSGHAILAYGITPTATGYDVEVDNPNSPHTAAEDTNPGFHDSQLENSRVHVDDNGTWTFPGLSWSGGFDKIGAYDVDRIPDTLSPPTGVGDIWIAIDNPDATAIGAVTDAAGKTIPGASSLASETGTGTGPMTNLIPRGVAFRASLKGRGGTLALFGGARAFSVENGGGSALTVDRPGRTLGLTGAPRGTALSATSDSAATTRVATATLGSAGDAAIGFAGSSALTLRAAGTVALTLGQVGTRGTGALRLNGLRLRTGETATVRPGSWTRAGPVAVTVRGKGGHVRRLALRSRRAAGVATVSALRLRARGGQVSATAKLRVPAGTATSATLSWQARKGRKVVRRGTIALTPAQVTDLAAGRAVGFAVRAPRGRYTVRATLVVGAVGARSAVPAVTAKAAKATVRIG